MHVGLPNLEIYTHTQLTLCTHCPCTKLLSAVIKVYGMHALRYKQVRYINFDFNACRSSPILPIYILGTVLCVRSTASMLTALAAPHPA